MKRLIVVGNGMAGVACVEHILKRSPDFEITIFGDETHVNYNRILLSLVLAGEKSADEIVLNGVEWYRSNNIRARLGVKIAGIDRAARTVIDEQGLATPLFDEADPSPWAAGHLYLPFQGIDKENVHVFRTLDDTQALLAKARKGLKTVVIGGGLLGLEAARGLQVRGCDVTVIHLADSLMERQLDTTGGEYLKRRIEGLGIPRSIAEADIGDFRERPCGWFAGSPPGEELEAELVVIAAGTSSPTRSWDVKPASKVNRGIVVNDFMETSDPDIFAVGECTEHRGQTFGLVAPAVRPGARAGSHDHGESRTRFHSHGPGGKTQDYGRRYFSRRVRSMRKNRAWKWFVTKTRRWELTRNC